MVTGPRKPTTTTQLGTPGWSITHRIRAMIATNSTIAKTMTMSLSVTDVGLKSQSMFALPFFHKGPRWRRAHRANDFAR